MDIPLSLKFTLLTSKHFENKSAMLNNNFVSDAVQDLVVSGRVIQVHGKPYMCNPLSGAKKHEKKRPILDLSFFLIISYGKKKLKLKI